MCVAFSPDGRTLATGSSDSTILLWDVTGSSKAGRAPPTRLTDAKLAALWEDLGAGAATAHEAVWRLIAAPAQSVSLLQEKLRPAAPPNPRGAKPLPAAPDSDRFRGREEPRGGREKRGEPAEPALRQALEREKLSVEARRAIEDI